MNIELAERVLAHIKEHRDAFNIAWEIGINDDNEYQVSNYPCGTTCCIAGWTVLLSEKQPLTEEDIDRLSCMGWETVAREAQELLRISYLEACQLFVSPLELDLEDENEFAITQFEEFIEGKKEALQI